MFRSVGIHAEKGEIQTFLDQVNGRDVTAMIAEGRKKLEAMPRTSNTIVPEKAVVIQHVEVEAPDFGDDDGDMDGINLFE